MSDETAPSLPIRIVVTDDLERSRVTVFFRLLLAIPHLVVVALWGIAAFAVSIVLWLALLFEGQGAADAAGVRHLVPPLLRAGERLRAPGGRARTRRSGAATATRSTSRSSRRRASHAAGSPLASCSPFPALLLALAVGGGSFGGELARAASLDIGPATGRSRSERRRRRGDGGSSRVVRVRRPGTHAARPPRSRRLLHRVHGAGHRLPAARHRSLSDERPRAGAAPRRRCRRTRSGSSSTDDVERSRLTVFFRFLLAIPHLIWLLLWSVLGSRRRARRLGRRSRHRTRAAGRCTASSPPGCATRCTSAPSCS